jgi:hypothetical protein
MVINYSALSLTSLKFAATSLISYKHLSSNKSSDLNTLSIVSKAARDRNSEQPRTARFLLKTFPPFFSENLVQQMLNFGLSTIHRKESFELN